MLSLEHYLSFSISNWTEDIFSKFLSKLQGTINFLRLFSNAHWLNQSYLCTLEAYFLTKVHEIWMHDYENEKASNIFHFSVSVIKLEFQPIGFLACHFFITFIRKLTQMLISTLFSRILGGLTEIRWMQFDFLL